MDREMDGEVKLEIFVWSTCGGIPTKKYWAPLPISWFTVFEIMPDKTRRQCGPKGNHETNIKCPFQTQVTHTEVSFQKISMVNDWRDVGDDNLVMVTMVMWWWYWWWKWLWSKKHYIHFLTQNKTFTYKQVCTKIWSTQRFLHTTLSQHPLLSRAPKKIDTQNFYKQKSLHTKTAEHIFSNDTYFTHRPFYTQASFTHTNFRRRCLHTQNFLRAWKFTV